MVSPAARLLFGLLVFLPGCVPGPALFRCVSGCGAPVLLCRGVGFLSTGTMPDLIGIPYEIRMVFTPGAYPFRSVRLRL